MDKSSVKPGQSNHAKRILASTKITDIQLAKIDSMKSYCKLIGHSAKDKYKEANTSSKSNKSSFRKIESL
jgi:hypothetical protein